MPPGQPTKYDPSMCKIIEDELAKGYSIEGCCAVLGISQSTIYNWMADAEKREFLDSINRGLSKALRYAESLLMAHMSGQPIKGFNPKLSSISAITFMLKTRFHKIYSEKHKIEAMISNKDGKSFKLAYDRPKKEVEDFIGV
jgi:hypothetical protein